MILLITIIVVLVVLILWFVVTYNSFIRLRNFIRESWSGVDVQLKRRYSLIPNLLETVKGYMKHERGLFEDVARIRTECMNTGNIREKGQAENSLTQTIKTLFAVAENYPDLKASQNFLDLQENISSIEEAIQLARRYYNGTVRNYNIAVESFPSMLVARMFGFKQEEFFQIEEESERESPEIKI